MKLRIAKKVLLKPFHTLSSPLPGVPCVGLYWVLPPPLAIRWGRTPPPSITGPGPKFCHPNPSLPHASKLLNCYATVARDVRPEITREGQRGQSTALGGRIYVCEA